MRLRRRDMAKVGQLVLAGGLWSGHKIVSKDWIEASTTRVPDAPTEDLRGLLRTRKQLIREQSSHVLPLEDANIKLDSVISYITVKSGRAMIKALIAGERDPAKLARLADGRLKASTAQLCEALRGRVTKNHRFLLRLHLHISGRSINWTPPSLPLIGKWRPTSRPFAPRSPG